METELAGGLGLGGNFALSAVLVFSLVLAATFALLAFWQWRKATTLRLERESVEALAPLKTKIEDFENLVRATYDREGRERFHLEKEIKSLASETQILSRSLRGDSKVQGDWGEFLVESILESSGLRPGLEFELQVSTKDDEGRVLRPDVVVRLPGDRSLVIDAKVSLVAWDRVCRSETETQREQAMNEHVSSLRRHVQSLSGKKYFQMKDSVSPEFVFMFTPIEPAWLEALRFDPSLLDEAASQGVVIVSPTTLYAALKTVSGLWARERQNKNALKIADEAGKLYDKFVQFSTDINEIGRDLEKASERVVQARRKLTEGPGNLVGRVEKIRELGAKSTKKLSDVLSPDEIET